MPDRRLPVPKWIVTACGLFAPILFVAAPPAEGRTRESALGVFAVVTPVCTASTTAGPAVRCSAGERTSVAAPGAPAQPQNRREAPGRATVELPSATKFFTIFF